MLNFLKPRNWGPIKVYRDFENFADWRKNIRREENNPNSSYTKWKLSHTKLYDVYTIITLDEADVPLPEVVKRTKVMEMLAPINRYLDNDLGFAECLDVEFNQFQDDNGKPTLSYLIVYRFSFEKFSLKWLLKFALTTSAIIFLIVKYELILQPIISWVSNLI